MEPQDNIDNVIAAPRVRVGIMSRPEIRVRVNGRYIDSDGLYYEFCDVRLTAAPGGVSLDGGKAKDMILLLPVDNNSSFTLRDVTIGVSFHWKRDEDQTFQGGLQVISERDGEVTAINIIHVEDYLKSVISSEMSATSSIELLKAHAVISRSWLLAQMQVLPPPPPEEGGTEPADDEGLRWWDHDDHQNFDVCADDHCQRYQGITRAGTQAVSEAIDATRGQVLIDENGNLCDARFSKSCGGVMEQFEYCWQPEHKHYLVARADSPDATHFPDLTIEDNARQWILSAPSAYCNTHDPAILSQVLNDYDQETTDFYRWTVKYTAAELADLIRRRTGIDYGRIRALEPVARGTSGRLWKLRVVGEKSTRVIGKELAIRYALSESCLYSSAFVVEYGDPDAEGYPTTFTLHGAGWGHGVGLCQIGAAVMGAQGIPYDKILAHYFPGSRLNKNY